MNTPPKLWRPPVLKSDLPKNEGEAQIDYPALLHGAFERRVAEFPDYIAVEAVIDDQFNTKTWTYTELNAKAEELADELSVLEREVVPWAHAYKNQRAVPMFIPGSPEFYIGVNGILKAGLAFCSLPLDAPPQRLLDIVEDAQASIVLGIGSSPFPGVDLSEDNDVNNALRKLVWVDMTDIYSWRAGKTLTSTEPGARHPPAEEDLAYILYTSGSTGKPKGVLISHLMVTCAISGHAAAFEPLPSYQDLRWLQFGMPTFDLSLLEIFLTLGYGGTLCSADRGLMLSDIEKTINFFKATSLFTVASLATLLRPKKLPTLTCIISGGEALTKYAIDNFSYDTPQEPGILPKKVINIYGPTETTMCATAETAGMGSRGSIAGEVFDCASVFLVDVNAETELLDVPMGLTGEIVFGGPMVGYGYMNRPEETAKAYTTAAGLGPVYRTGDKGRFVWSPEGKLKLEILGRFNMEQVKLNTRRVELGEIESTIARVEAIREIATVVIDGSFLAAYLGLNGDESEDPVYHQQVINDCRAAADAGLPNWMRPVEYIVVPKVPRTSSGKIDRKTLQKIAFEQFGASTAHKEPSPSGSEFDAAAAAAADAAPTDLTNIESILTMLQNTFRVVVGTDSAALSDSTLPLNACGLDSLRAMKFLQELRKQDVEGLALKDVLAGSNFNEVAQVVLENHAKALAEAAVAADEDDELPQIEDEEELLTLPLAAKLKHFSVLSRAQCIEKLGIPSEDIVDILPATGIQVRMLSNIEEARDFGVNKPWVEHFPYEVPDHIDADRLEKAIVEAMNGRDAFRTVWVEVDHPLAPFAQCVLSPDSPHAAHPVIKMTVPTYSQDPKSLWMRTYDHAQKTAEEYFDLHSMGSVTTFIRSLDNKHCVVIFSMFHLIYDGMSLAGLGRDISEAYQGLPITGFGKPGVRVPVEEHYGSDWLGTTMFWMNRLAGVASFQFGDQKMETHDNSFISVNPGVGVGSESLVSNFSLGDLLTISKEKNLFGPMAIVQAAWAMTLAQTLPKPNAAGDAYDVQFGSVFHGRQKPDSLDAFGLMLDALPMRITFPSDKQLTNREVCNLLFGQYTEALPFTEMPCPNVQFARTTRRFDTTVILQAFPKSQFAEEVEGLPAFNRAHDVLVPWRETNAGNPLLLELWPGKDSTNDKLSLRLTYSQVWPGYEFMTQEWIQGMLVTLHEALIALTETPDELFSPVYGRKTITATTATADVMDCTE